VSWLLGLHPSGIESIGVACKGLGWQVSAANCVPVQTTPPSWPLAVAAAAKPTAPIKKGAKTRPPTIACLTACLIFAAKDVTVLWGPQGPLNIGAVTTPRRVRGLSAKLIGSYTPGQGSAAKSLGDQRARQLAGGWVGHDHPASVGVGPLQYRHSLYGV
jgi:hypothetical protein